MLIYNDGIVATNKYQIYPSCDHVQIWDYKNMNESRKLSKKMETFKVLLVYFLFRFTWQVCWCTSRGRGL